MTYSEVECRNTPSSPDQMNARSSAVHAERAITRRREDSKASHDRSLGEEALPEWDMSLELIHGWRREENMFALSLRLVCSMVDDGWWMVCGSGCSMICQELIR